MSTVHTQTIYESGEEAYPWARIIMVLVEWKASDLIKPTFSGRIKSR